MIGDGGGVQIGTWYIEYGDIVCQIEKFCHIAIVSQIWPTAFKATKIFSKNKNTI